MPTVISGSDNFNTNDVASQTELDAKITATGDAPIFGCRAWVNFDGKRDSTGATSTANTARFIRASGNVSSVMRNGTGDYTVNFTAPMEDADYSAISSGESRASSGSVAAYIPCPKNYLVSSVGIGCEVSTASGYADIASISVSVFR